MQGAQGPQGAPGVATLAGGVRTVPFCLPPFGLVSVVGDTTVELPFAFNHAFTVVPPVDPLRWEQNAFVVQKPNTVVRRLAVSYQGTTQTFNGTLAVVPAIRRLGDPSFTAVASSAFTPSPIVLLGDGTFVSTANDDALVVLQPGDRLTLEVIAISNFVGGTFRINGLAASVGIEENAVL